MKTITFNGKFEKITAPEERCLRQMASNGFAAAVSDFSSHRRGGWLSTDLPQEPNRLKALGIRVITKYRLADWAGYKPLNTPLDEAEKRAARVFAARPRVQQAAIGNPRRINAILARLGTA